MDYFTFWYKNDENAFHTQTGSYILSNASKNLHETRKSLPYIKQHPPRHLHTKTHVTISIP